MDTSIFHDCLDLDNRYIGSSHWYYQKGLLRKLRDSDVVIDDLGIFVFLLGNFYFRRSLKSRKFIIGIMDGMVVKDFEKWIKRAYFGLADGAFIYGNYARNLMIKMV